MCNRENLLSTLLQLTQHLLKDGPPKIPGSTLGSQLVSIILKVIFVLYWKLVMVGRYVVDVYTHMHIYSST